MNITDKKSEREYSSPVLEIVRFAAEDVVRTSGLNANSEYTEENDAKGGNFADLFG